MNRTGNPEPIVMGFSKVCSDPLQFTVGTDDRLIASEFIHKILTKITEYVVTPTPDLVSSAITALENDIIEYIAGYTLKKATAKFPSSRSIFAQLTAIKPCWKLIPLMERKSGALRYPSMDLLFLLRRIYREFTKECSKSPAQIDFTPLHERVAESTYLDNFARIISSVYLSVCGYSFAKKLFQKIR